MATKQADGISDVTVSSTRNNGGTIKLISGGSISGTPEPTGSLVVEGVNADKALSTGTFAYNNESPIAKKLTASLAGVNTSALLTSAGDPSHIRSIHKLEVVRTRRLTSAIREGKFNDFTGKFDAGYPVVAVDDFYDVSTNTLSETSTDEAAAPTREVPGELTYLVGVTPVDANYPEKTS